MTAATSSPARYGLDPKQLRLNVIRPVLKHLGLDGSAGDHWNQAAENLVLGTALTESHGQYLQQLGGGPALGLWQMEPATHDDIWRSYVRFQPGLSQRLDELQTRAALSLGAQELVGNLYYAAAMCRVHYRRVKAPLPPHFSAWALAVYYKEHYNTPAGASTVDSALPHFQVACG